MIAVKNLAVLLNMTLTAAQIRECLMEPEMAAHMADLVYVQDQHLNIYRKKYGRGFTYLLDNKERLKDKNQVKRIKQLVIPPAWKKVRISHLPNGHLQVVGRDDKNRKVYLYHDIWTILRNQTKFFKMSAFAKALPAIRKQLKKDLSQQGMPLTKCLALVLTIMDETYVRMGSEQYARRNKTYGLSTMRMKHVSHEEDHIDLDFTGKKGVDQHIEIDDTQLVKLLHQVEEIPGWELFQYYDDAGNHQPVDSGMINAYLQEISSDIFTAKDFRTWGATREFFSYLIDLEPESKLDRREKNALKAYDAAADALGNTRAVCRQYYVHPQIADVYLTDGFKSVRSQLEKLDNQANFTASEQCIEQLINEFEIKFKDA